MLDASPYAVRIGIMGCASIARKNARAIIRSERCTLVAVASRELPKANAFCDELKLDQSVRRIEGYDALLADKGVDAVYIPLPTKLHREWVSKAAAAGKHILVEKPVGVDANEVQEMIAACRAAGVAFMDGTMFVHHKRFKQVDRIFADTTWQPKRVTSAFTFAAPIEFLAGGNIRTNGLRPASFFASVEAHTPSTRRHGPPRLPRRRRLVLHTVRPGGLQINARIRPGARLGGDGRRSAHGHGLRRQLQQWRSRTHGSLAPAPHVPLLLPSSLAPDRGGYR